MKKLIYFSLLLIVVAGCAYLYKNSPYLQAKVHDLIGAVDDSSGIGPINANQQVGGGAHKAFKKGTPKKLKPDEFSVLDDYARHTPEKYTVDIPSLAAYLQIPAKNDVDKARLLFTWIATHIKYDDDAYNTGNYGDLSAAGVLKSRKSVCEGYSALFQELGTAMGLQVKKLTGYAKGYGYTIGEHFKETNHAWNLVQLENHWRPFDVTWGSGYGVNRKGLLVSTSRFEPYWFNVNPREFIFRHLPEEAIWQLTGNKISLSQYEALPYLDESFFKLGFDADKIFADAVVGKTKDFVKPFNQEFPLKIIQMPYAEKLKKGEPIKIVITSDYAEQMELVDGTSWLLFAREGNNFSLAYTPANTAFEIAVKINSFDKNFSTFAKYRVIAPQNITASN